MVTIPNNNFPRIVLAHYKVRIVYSVCHLIVFTGAFILCLHRYNSLTEMSQNHSSVGSQWRQIAVNQCLKLGKVA